jgi:hypothetical protein
MTQPRSNAASVCEIAICAAKPSELVVRIWQKAQNARCKVRQLVRKAT